MPETIIIAAYLQMLMSRDYYKVFIMKGQSFKLVINNPCSQNWDTMLPSEMGRYCLSCKKAVIDFSIMKDEEINSFVINNGGQSVCGRFRNEQLERVRIYIPGNIFRKRIANWKKFLAILLVCFGSSLFSVDVVWGNPIQYEQTQQPKPKHTVNNKTSKKRVSREKKINWDTLIVMEHTMGLFVPIPCGPLPPQSVDIIPPDTLPNIEEDKKMKISNSTVSTDLKGKNKEDQPKEKKPKEKFEFILPAPLRIRKRLLK